MAGVAIEIIVAIGFAVHDVVEKYEMDRQTAANAPLNRPITRISGNADFVVRGTVNEVKWYRDGNLNQRCRFSKRHS